MGYAYPVDSILTYIAGEPQYDRAVSSETLRSLYAAMMTNGIILRDSTNLQVVENEGLKLKVKSGFCLMNGCMKKFDKDTSIELAAAEATRVDTIVARLNLNQEVRDITIEVIQGTGTEPPALVREGDIYDLGLANVTVNVGAVTIAQADINDTRLDTERCGIISSISEFDTKTLYDQMNDSFYNWFESIKGKLGDDVAGGLQMQIDGLADDIDTLQEEMTRVETLESELEEINTNKMDIVNPTFTGNLTNAEFTEFPYNIKGSGSFRYNSKTYSYTKAYFKTMPTNYSAKNLSVPEGEIYIPLKDTGNSFLYAVSSVADNMINQSKEYYGVNSAVIIETNSIQYTTTLVGFEKVNSYDSYYDVYAILKVPENFPYSNDGRTCSIIAISANNVTIDGNVSFGENNTLTHKNCALFGNNLQGKGYQVNMGHYNDYYNVTNGSSSGTSGTALCIGNGTSSARANAFRVDYNGTIYAQNSTVSTGADYSEYFEWFDGNEDNEDRVGYFVTFDDKQKIRKANATDNYILGIVSGLPCIIGNGDECWKGRYIYDEFGRFIEETFEYEEIVDGKSVTKIGTKYKENPEYNPNQPYEERAKRKEWSAIGMMGVLSVYDDGTCQANGYCKVSDGGIATSCEYGANAYRVLERVTDDIIKVLFR